MALPDPIYRERFDRILRDVAAVGDRNLRVHKVVSVLKRLRPEEAADFLRAAVELAEGSDPRCQDFCLLFVNGVAILEREAGDAWWGRFTARIGEIGDARLAEILRDMLDPDSWIFALDDEELPKSLPLSLGHKRNAARQGDPFLLDRLLFEPDPGIVANLLNNPRITEREVLRIATRRPVSPDILAMIGAHPRWGIRYGVRKALTFNPWSPPRVAAAIIPALLMADLELLFADTSKPEIRQAVERVVVRRYAAMTEGEQAQFLRHSSGQLLEILLERDRRSLDSLSP